MNTNQPQEGIDHSKTESTRRFNPVYSARAQSIFPTMSALAREHNAINLGQGFPDEDGPLEIRQYAAEGILAGPNQYAPVEGTPEIRRAVAADNKRFYGLDIDPMRETLIVAGATEGLASIFLGLLNPGDEAIAFSPFYECYAPQIEAAGARFVPVALEAPDWRIDRQRLEAAITERTQVIVINSPHNPLGRVLDTEELHTLAAIAEKHDLIVVCDEVYEHLVFDDHKHIPLMTLPNMFDRCVRIGSAGKTFSLTGFRVGYITGPEPIVTAVMKAHQHIAYTLSGPIQNAIAHALEFGDHYYTEFRAGLTMRRDRLEKGLRDIGFEVGRCEGTYFLNVDIRSFGYENDVAFCREMTEKAKVTAVPISAFFHPSETEAPKQFARFCFCKKPEVLDEAMHRLSGYLLQ
ncbi:MAG: aminotransferase [Pseudomonadota bacterium]